MITPFWEGRDLGTEPPFLGGQGKDFGVKKKPVGEGTSGLGGGAEMLIF